MKKTLIALAALGAMAGIAHAQSSVTLYGVADAFVGSKELNSVNAAGVVTKRRQTVLDSSGLNSSRWGLRGNEDLGGGMKAVFVLESGLNIDTGASASTTSLFNRQAFVGLESGFGTVSLGRQYSAYFSVHNTFLSAQALSTSFDATNSATINTALVTGLTSTATPAQVLVAANSYVGRIGAWTGYQTRIDNSIRYATPNFSGFQAAVVYGFGENKSATVDATKNISLNLTYANGPIGVGVAHADDELIKGFRLKNTAIGGYYDFGVAKTFLSYNQAKITGFAKQTELAFGVRAPLGAATLVAQYAQSKGDDLGKSTSVGLEGQYSLSKRTTAYTAFNRTKIDDFNNAKNTVFGLGVRHTF